MIIGKGLLASQLTNYKDSDDMLIFASGVSNSSETKNDNFKRELDLIQSYCNTDSVFIYFSTCSIYDKSNENSLYVKHKLKAELFIQSNFKSYLIVRLPNMIGLTNNSHTFFNYFYDAIISGTPINIYSNAVRYFMDVEDLNPIIKMLLNDEKSINSIINVCYNNSILIPEAVSIFEKYLNKKATATIVDKGSNYNIPNKPFLNLLDKNQVLLPEQYTENCFRKYIELKARESYPNQKLNTLFNHL
jgi:nucleoside-diphosphate-sugar epimerase